MLTIKVLKNEFWDPKNEVFIEVPPTTLNLEHSLISISKWEAIWHIPFLGKEQKSEEQMRSYVECMTLNKGVDPNVYLGLNADNRKRINDYISNPMTASTFPPEKEQAGKHETVTSELIYYWMVANFIPFECEKWHLNRLLTLIKTCSFKNAPPKKLGKNQLMRNNAALNAARRAKYHSHG